MSVTPLDGFVLNGSEYEMRDKLAQSRIDNLVAQNNPTDGNTELLDIRVGADGHTYDSAGQAVRSQIEQLHSKSNFNYDLCNISETNIVESLKTGKFYFPLIWERGSIYSSNGMLDSNELGNGAVHIRTKNFVKLPQNQISQIFCSESCSYFICGYDSEKNYLGYQMGSVNTKIQINQNYAFIKLVAGIGSEVTPIIFGDNFELYTTDINQSRPEIMEFIENRQIISNKYERLLSNIVESCEFNASTSLWDDLPGNRDYIFINLPGNDVVGGAKLQIAIGYSLSAADHISVWQRVVANNDNIVGDWIELTSNKMHTQGKKCGCLGDSITAGDGGTSWVTKLKEYCRFSNVVNYGLSGSTIKSDGSSGFLDRYDDMLEDLDYIVVWGGVNDFIWTTQTKSEFKENYENLISNLITKYPAAKILGITPMKFEYTGEGALLSRKWDTPRSDGVVLKDYRDAEIEVLEKYSVPYLDFFISSGISCENSAQATSFFASTTDHLHPNTNGNLLVLAPKISEALKNL